MKIHWDIDQLPEFNNAVITIGSFDGVHLGHRKILKKVKKLAVEFSGESILITFHPHPRSVIYPRDNDLKLLNTIDEKLSLIEECDIDHVVIVPFTIEFSQLSAQEYLEEFIEKKFKPVGIVIGYDHRFGLNRHGNIHFLRDFANENQIKVVEIEKQELEDVAISSTKIRNALLDCRATEARNLLGYPYILSGKVTHGDKIGQEIGYPTANIKIEDTNKLIPAFGVYAVEVKYNTELLYGMLYIGDRPTVKSTRGVSLEVNIFDFDLDIYGEELQVHLLDFIRGDLKLNSLDELGHQLEKDEMAVRKVLANLYPEKKKPKCTIAILNYNGLEHLEAYLPSVLDACPYDCNIAVIDNASTDDSVSFLEEWFPEVKVISLDQNHGFAGGYNLGLQHIDSHYYFILNSDVKLEPNSLDILLRSIEKDPSVAAVQPSILSLENPDYYEYAGASGGYIDALGYPYCRGRIFDHIEEFNPSYHDSEIDWATGAAFLVNAQVFHQIGGFDESYFAHQEEIDLCWRLRRAGYKIKVNTASKVYHLGGGTLEYENPRKIYLNFRNNLATILKNAPISSLFWLFPLRLILDGIAGIKFLLNGHYKSTFQIIKAHLHTYLRIGNIIERRNADLAAIKQTDIGDYHGRIGAVFSILWQFYIKGNKVYQQLK